MVDQELDRIKKIQPDFVLLIPAFNPDNKLIFLIESVLERSERITVVVVDDGSGAEFQWVFSRIMLSSRCVVCHHQKNLGKGAALKTGINYVIEHFFGTTGIITADSDGQHSSLDILKIAEATEKNPSSIILGKRNFSSKEVTFKSRSGNKITSSVFRFVTKITCLDTQTGLRGIPPKYYFDAAYVEGNRYEYEMNFLLQFAGRQIPFFEIPIETIYINKNKGSHFHPFFDSLRIYQVIFDFYLGILNKKEKSQVPLRFALASLLSFFIDISLF